jgi:HAD superfamily hydrolase (TIGR01450 family)
VTLTVCLDLDGVVWLGPAPIAGAAEAIDTLRAAGVRVGYITNNSGRTPASIVEQLGAMGVPAAPEDVLTSAHAAAKLLARSLGRGARVLACAGPGVVEALGDAGFEVVRDGPAAAAVVGWHRDFDYDELDRTAATVRDGARFVATNLDPTYPGPDRPLPGNGALVAAVATASGVQPEVAGKPEPAMVALVRDRFGDQGVMVGDRPSTDGALAAALGWPFALVLSGVAGEQGDEAVPDPAPAHVAADLAALAPHLLAT